MLTAYQLLVRVIHILFMYFNSNTDFDSKIIFINLFFSHKLHPYCNKIIFYVCSLSTLILTKFQVVCKYVIDKDLSCAVLITHRNLRLENYCCL